MVILLFHGKKTNSSRKILALYLETNKLKTTLRQGWLIWHLEEKRIEGVVEHVFGTGMLTVSIFANTKIDVDVSKLVLMLALHKIEEIKIGDLTPSDDTSKRKENGQKAVHEVFEESKNKKQFLDIIAEYEEGKTKEAKLAKQIDKLEAYIQAYLYDKNFKMQKIDKNLVKQSFLTQLFDSGCKTVAQCFLKHDERYYEGITKEITDLLKILEEGK